MKPIPSLIIVTDRGHLRAYLTQDNGSLEAIDHAQFAEGNQRLSEMFSDQAGAFPSEGSGTSHAERLPLEEELEVRCFRQIAAKTREIIDRVNPVSWGLSAPSEINNAILQEAGEKCRKNLAVNLKLNLTNSPPDEIRKRFVEARQKAAGEI